MSDTMIVKNMNWISISKLETSLKVKAKIRQQHRECDAVLYPTENEQIV